MFCKNCGSELNEGVTFCPNCGAKVSDVFQGQESYHPGQGGETGEAPYAVQNEEMYREPEKKPTDGFAIASLVLGIVSFFIVPIVGAILAIVFGNKSIRDNGMNTMAHVGKILGIISLVLYCVVVAVLVVLMIAGIGLLGMGAYYF